MFGLASGKRPRRLPRRSARRLITAGLLFSAVLCFVVFGQRPAGSQPGAAEAASPMDEMILVPVPLKQISRGEKLAAAEFREVAWPKSAFGSGDFLRGTTNADHFIALSTLPAHMPIPLSAISDGGVDANAVVEGIPQGMRAITVKVDAESAVEGWARSGSYVDVILLRQSKAADSGIEAKVIAENVRILSAGRSTEPLAGQTSAPQAPATVTLLVSQENALKIKTASNVGKLTFALRGTGDEEPTMARSVNQRDLLDGARTIIPAKQNYQGRATGPDGKVYVLSSDSRWVRSLEAEPPAQEATEPSADDLP